jgi:hypothetical protein
MIFDICTFNPVTNMLAIHAGEHFLRVQVEGERDADFLSSILAGTPFEKKSHLIYQMLQAWFPMTIQQEFWVAREHVREKGPKTTSDFAMLLPGVDQMVKHPLTGEENVLYYIIIDLNDGQKWSRDQIADWIESLDTDVRFK